MAQECFLDVSDLEPPEPLVRALEAVKRLSDEQFLHLKHRRKPCLLYENIGALGFASETRDGGGGMCDVFIWKQGNKSIESAARCAAESLPPWKD
jgi:hypothetical protein